MSATPDKSEPKVGISNLTKTFPGAEEPALDRISARIETGQMTGLVGPDGAGKTTLIRLITGLLHADRGKVRVAGYDSTTHPEAIHAISGYMPQKFGLYEDLTVLENLNLYADLRGVTGTERRRKFDRLLEFTALKDFQKRLAGALSGGMKQKLGLACALIGDPQLLLLDEPSVGVDPISRRELWSMVRELAGSGMAVLWSTAYLDEAQKCDTVILLNAGKKLHDGPPSELLQRVQGRTFLIDGVPAERRRALLMRTLSQPEVIDGVIQGSQIRIVLAPDTASKPTLNEAKAQWRQVKPWFEDGFVDILGGGPGGRSVLAERMTDKPRKDAPLIEAMELTKRFGDFTAVQDNSFRIYRGEIFGLLGPNGAGKSTTFKMMCGLLQPTSGEAYVDGLSLVRAGSQARARIGYMAQKFSLYGNLSVRENLRFFAGLYEVPDDKPKQMVEIFELDRYATQTAGQLPLGIKQRLALACAVMHEPEVLFLDEPTSGVDPITRREFWTHINGMVTRGVTVMVTTHFMDESEYCDRIGLIYRGRNIATGTPDDLKEQVRSHQLPNPTLEEAFIELVQSADQRAEEVA